jgi:predicted Zn-dependent peptidase
MLRHTVYEVTLQNGGKGLFIHIPEASVMNFEVNFRAGEYLVSKKKWEAPHIMEHLLFGANEEIPKSRTFQAEFEKNGAYSNASINSYEIVYEAECADFEWDRIAGLIQLAITKPLFLESEYLAETGNVREELVMRSNNHFRQLNLSLRQAYGYRILTDQERLELMKNVELEDIWKHYKSTHTTSNMRFVIAGKLPADRRKIITEIFEKMDLPKGKGRFELPVEKPHSLKEALYINNETVKNLYFFIDTFILRRINNPEADALNLLNIMMTETFYSRILGAAREKGLVYDTNSGFGQTRNSTNWWVGAQVLPDNTGPLFDIIVKEIKAIQRGRLNEDDLKAAQQYALGRFQRSGQTVGGTASGYSSRYFFDGIVDDYYKIPERITDVTKKGIVDITKELFSKNIWGIGGLGSTGEEFMEELRSKITPLWK